ncbi:hypothetical protein [Actinomycetospora sp. NBRC 106378]|jgi:hypothetical protein|uniref:hypothetical protein n=1 Tax=Actinomycetospora sp. NBRC 106378 TaxID=3032208 RepID=UPI0024A40A94|nr:hypothetical protein [Actinomycetospora sp. NBRC 106378]GLZ54267.1 hypothetical protein Acsp07_38840 [Actinomycetospora sp. NBRC 106378]
MGKAAASTWVDALARLRPRERVVAAPAPARVVVDPVQACALTGAKRAKKKCCRSTPRCKGCPVVLMRAARAAESGLTGKDLARAVKRARAA